MRKTIYTFVCFLIYQFLSAGIALVWVNAERLNDATTTEMLMPDGVTLGISMFVCSFLLLLLLWYFRLIRRRPINRGVSLKLSDGGIAVVGFISLSFGLSILLSPFQLDDGGQMAVFAGMKDNVLCLLLLAVVGPLIEEVVFREGIMRHLISGKVHPLLAAAGSAALFAIIHGNAAQAVPAFILGFVFGLYYLRTGDIRLCLFLHIVNNTLALLLLYFPEGENAISELPSSLQICVGLTGLGIGALVTWRETFKKKRQSV